MSARSATKNPSSCFGKLNSPNQALQLTVVHVYKVRPRKDHRGVDLISDALPFGRLWYDGPGAVSNAIGYAEHRSRSHHAMIRVYDETGNVIETHTTRKLLAIDGSSQPL